MSNPQFPPEEFEAYLDPCRNGLPEGLERQLTTGWAELFGSFTIDARR